MLMKNRTLLVLKYLWEKTDEENSVSTSDIVLFLTAHGMAAPDPRSIKKDIADLLELGIDIVSERRDQNHYRIVSRNFDTAEIKLLIDAIQSARFISAQKSNNLIKKLAVFVNDL